MRRKSEIDIDNRVATLRKIVIGTTTKIGTQAPEYQQKTTILQTRILNNISDYEESIAQNKDNTETISIERLYEERSEVSTPSPILLLLDMFIRYGAYLQNAIDYYEDEVSREGQMSLFNPIVYEMDYVKDKPENLSEIFTMLKVALYSKMNIPYTRDEILSLKTILSKLKNNPLVPDYVKDEILDSLYGNFDISGPLGIEIEG